MSSAYLQRVAERRDFLDLKRQMVLGLVGGWLLGAFAAFRYLYVAAASERTCLLLGGAAALLFAAGLLCPRRLGPVERGIRAATGWIGKGILAAVLTLTYFLVVTPVGLAWQVVRGRRPFHGWAGEPPPGMEGWTPKVVVEDQRLASGTARRRPLLTQPFVIVGYFVRYGHFALIPVLVFLLGAGLVLFFVKSSALAPFIYTLF